MRTIKKEKCLFSETISAFLGAVARAQFDYKWNYAEVNKLDKLTQDYLHNLELKNLNYSERAKVATQIAKCRQERRKSKDTVEILKPIVEFFDSDKGKQLLKLMNEVLGQTRKVEKKMETRTYKYKVMEEEDSV